MIRVDKTLSELYYLTEYTDSEVSETASMAINTIKRLFKENEKLEMLIKIKNNKLGE